MASHHRIAIAIPAIVALLAIAPAEARAVELAQNAPIATPPKIVMPPGAVMPDLWAHAYNVKLTCVKGVTVTATMSVKVDNLTKVDADLTKHPFQHIVTARVAKVTTTHHLFDGNLNQVVTSPGGGPAVLKGGTSVMTAVTLTNIPRSKEPQYRFEVIVDPTNLVAEANEQNNLTIKDVFNSCR